MKPRITTTISMEQWKLCQQNQWKWSDVVKAGIGSLVSPSIQVERIQALEAETKALRTKLNNMAKGQRFF